MGLEIPPQIFFFSFHSIQPKTTILFSLAIHRVGKEAREVKRSISFPREDYNIVSLFAHLTTQFVLSPLYKGRRKGKNTSHVMKIFWIGSSLPYIILLLPLPHVQFYVPSTSVSYLCSQPNHSTSTTLSMKYILFVQSVKPIPCPLR